MPSNADSQPREDGCECAGSARLPRTLIAAVAALACLPIGLLWDISHHSSIGRDTFWTPAHIVIQFGGIVPALLFLVIACKTTFRGTAQERACSVALWRARAPLGVWVTLWGALAMMTSAPFDDWWHNSYGLDVKIASPPHSVLGLGMFAVGMGVLLVVFSSQNRADSETQRKSGIICALACGILIALLADFTTEFSWPNLQRTSTFYKVVAIVFPFFLITGSRASKVFAGATIAAATYMTIYILMILILPLFPAHPKLAPIYHPITHMGTPPFPLLLIVPAAALDSIRNLYAETESAPAGSPHEARYSPRAGRHDWLLAIVLGTVFLCLLLAVQWFFSAFLLSPAADNRFFARNGYWPYFAQPGNWMDRFWDSDRDPLTVKGLFVAEICAVLSARSGLWFGDYLLRLKR
jgi:hypothetical protein